MKNRSLNAQPMPAVDHGQSTPPDVYLRHLELARNQFRVQVDLLIKKILHLQRQRVTLDAELSELIGEFNAISPRRHNSLSVSWVIRPERIATALTQPEGPTFCRVVQPRAGGRFRNRVTRVTAELCRDTCHGKHTGQILRLYDRITALKTERNRVNKQLTAVRTALQHVDVAEQDKPPLACDGNACTTKPFSTKQE